MKYEFSTFNVLKNKISNYTESYFPKTKETEALQSKFDDIKDFYSLPGII